MGIRNTITCNGERSGSGRRLTKRAVIVSVVATATLMAAGGVAIASVVSVVSIASRGGGVLHGCYSTTTGVLRVINPSARQSCKAGERAIQWNAAGITWRGSWNRTITYSVHDAVVYGGSSYLAIAAGADRVPSDSPRSWSVLAASGAPGPAGPGGSNGGAGPAGPTGPAGSLGPSGPAGSLGPSGPAGSLGPSGPAGSLGPSGPAGSLGPSGPAGSLGPSGPAGSPGPTGPTGPSGILAFAEFFALMTPDNAATVAVGTAVSFPQSGPTDGSSGITRVIASPSAFTLAATGTYSVSFQVSVTEAGQLALALNGTALPDTVVGRATGTSQIWASVLIQATAGDVLTVVNPAGNSTALTITPSAGGTHSVSATLVIRRLL
jgi:hypothetical protein